MAKPREQRTRPAQTELDLHCGSAEPRLSIVIPAYNEQNRLPKTVAETISWCSMRRLAFDLTVADDGSTDETLATARLLARNDARIHVLSCPHLGKGAAVRAGILASTGEVVMFMDADGATPLPEVSKLLRAIGLGNDVAIGSRVARGAALIEVRTSLHRRLIGRVFAFFVNVLAVTGIADTQCGFKMFRRAAADAVFSRQRSAGFAFDVEVLYVARRLGFSIAEVPVNWDSQPGSKVNILTDSVRMLWDVARVRWLQRHCARDWRPEVRGYVPERALSQRTTSSAELRSGVTSDDWRSPTALSRR